MAIAKRFETFREYFTRSDGIAKRVRASQNWPRRIFSGFREIMQDWLSRSIFLYRTSKGYHTRI